MNESRTVTYVCPYCGRKFETEVYDSIITDTDPDLRDRCVSGDLFRISCPHCKRDYMIQYPLVYVDRKNRFILFVSSEPEVPEAVRKIAAGPAAAGYRMRRTPTLSEFSEKIQIFEDGVDDRLVELAKYDSLIEFIDNRKGSAEDVTGIEYQRTENGVMKFNVRTEDRGMSFLIPVTMIEEELEQDKDRYRIDDENFPVINAEWIIDLFQPDPGSHQLN